MASVDPKTGKPVVSSAGKFWGMNTIYGRDGEHGTPYMTRVWFWGLRLHIFHRPDLDEDCHDHPWDFTTFPIWPLTGYVEEVVTHSPEAQLAAVNDMSYEEWVDWQEGKVEHRFYKKRLQVVPAFRFSHRPATHCHRVLGAHDPRGDIMGADAAVDHFDEYLVSPGVDPNRKIVTLVWRSEIKRSWGFLKNREGKWCWVAWRDYVFAEGKDGPCQ